MKKQILSLVIVAAFAGNAYAADTQQSTRAPSNVKAVATSTLNALDMQAAFQQDKQPMQVAMLSGQEMKETEGAWGWSGVIIAVVGYANNYWGRTSGSAHDKAVSAGIKTGLNGASIINGAFL